MADRDGDSFNEGPPPSIKFFASRGDLPVPRSASKRLTPASFREHSARDSDTLLFRIRTRYVYRHPLAGPPGYMIVSPDLLHTGGDVFDVARAIRFLNI